MAEVKFAVSAAYKGVRYPARTPFFVDDRDFEAIIADGGIAIIPPTSEPPVNSVDEEIPEEVDTELAKEVDTELAKELKKLEDMTVSALKEYARVNNINISGMTLKEDIRDAIEDALAFSE